MNSGSPGSDKFSRFLESSERLLELNWEDWLGIAAPYGEVAFSVQAVTARYERNGYLWDIHGSIYQPEKEADARRAFVLFHGGACGEKVMDLTPDGRPGLARVLAAQGFKTLALTYTGHHHPDGVWKEPVDERRPFYLLDRELPEAEIRDRNLKCTFSTILQGAGLLVDTHLKDRELLAFGHSTGGPMAAHLHRFSKMTRVVGIVGFGSGGPDGWRKEWRETTGAEKYQEKPLEAISRRSPESFRRASYEDPRDLTPWGGAEEFMRWANEIRSQIKTGLCDNQHMASIGILEEYPKKTGLPREEYFDHLKEPDPDWLENIRVLLLVGEKDRGHWLKGDRLEDKREMFMAEKYAACTKDARLVLIPRYGHAGYLALHNEKLAYLWLRAARSGYFG